MNQLFNCKNIKWNGTAYEDLPEEDIEINFENDDENLEEYYNA